MIPNGLVWYLDKKTMNEIKDGLCLSYDIFLITVSIPNPGQSTVQLFNFHFLFFYPDKSTSKIDRNLNLPILM